MPYENSVHVAALRVNYILSIHGHRIAVAVVLKRGRRRTHSTEVVVEMKVVFGNATQ